MKTFLIRDIEDKLHQAVKLAALNAGKSMREWILDLLAQSVKSK